MDMALVARLRMPDDDFGQALPQTLNRLVVVDQCRNKCSKLLGAGIVPCPGTIVVFLFTISMGMYALGALSAVVMSLGMGLTIAITAALGTALRKKSSAYGQKALKSIDILGVSIMLLAGTFLVFS